MTTNVGYATLSVIPSLDGFESRLNRATSGPLSAAGATGGTRFGDAAGKSAGKRFTSVFKTAAKAGLIGLAGAGALAIKFGGDAVSAASDLAESTNKVEQVFGKSAKTVLKFTETTADALGQTNSQAREAASTFGIFGQAAGLSDRKSAKFAKRMTTLASDLASFNNTEPDQAVQALGAALRGESEPIRAYGVLLDEATLKAEALRLGLLKPTKDKAKIFAYQVRITDLQKTYNEAVADHGKSSLEALKAEAALGTARVSLQKATEGTIPPLTQQQKLLAAQSEIFKQTGVAQGDFARTSDGLANQQRRLSARFEDAKAKLGAGLLPIMSKAADFLLDKGIPAFEDFSDWFNKAGIPAVKRFGEQVKPLAEQLLPAAGDAFKSIRNFARQALPFVEGVVTSFNDMPDWVKKVLIGGVAGGLTAKKLGLFSLLGSTKKGAGGGSGLLGLVTQAKPLPVFVVNQTGGLPGGGGGGKPGIPVGAPKVGTLPKFAPLIPIGLGSAPGQQSLLKKLTGIGLGGSDPEGLGDVEENTKRLKDQDLVVGSLRESWIKARLASKDYAFQVHNGIPRSAITTVTDWPLWNKRAKDYLATLLEIRGLHMDTRLDGLAPTRSTTPGPVAPNRTGPASQRPININVSGVTVDSTRDMERLLVQRAKTAAMGGFG